MIFNKLILENTNIYKIHTLKIATTVVFIIKETVWSSSTVSKSLEK